MQRQFGPLLVVFQWLFQPREKKRIFISQLLLKVYMRRREERSTYYIKLSKFLQSLHLHPSVVSKEILDEKEIVCKLRELGKRREKKARWAIIIGYHDMDWAMISVGRLLICLGCVAFVMMHVAFLSGPSFNGLVLSHAGLWSRQGLSHIHHGSSHLYQIQRLARKHTIWALLLQLR